MFSFFKSKAIPDLSFLGADMHSHLLPALDDGLKNMEDTMDFMRTLHNLGYQKLICTPHVIKDIYPNNDYNTIKAKLLEVQQAAKKENLPVIIEAAAEYMVDPDFEKLITDDQPLLTFGDNHILIEMSYVAASPNIEKVIFDLCIKGYKPIVAHPERYSFYHSDFEKYQRLIDLGAVLQLNILSLSGYYGKYVMQTAEKLIKEKMISFAGTDMHHANHMNALQKLLTKKSFYKLINEVELQNKMLL